MNPYLAVGIAGMGGYALTQFFSLSNYIAATAKLTGYWSLFFVQLLGFGLYVLAIYWLLHLIFV